MAIFLLVLFGGASSLVYAEDLTGTNFIVRDPIIGTGGSFQSGGVFQMFGSGQETIIGESTSASFIGRAGFLYYPYAQSGVLTANVVVSDIELSWTASQAGLGYTVDGYKVGIASVAGGPYVYTTVGNVTSYTYENKSPGTYFIVVETLDPSGNTIALSNEEEVTVDPSISFTLSDNSIGFGTLTPSGARYATGDGSGSGSPDVAHTLSVATNGPTGYSVVYNGPALSASSKVISGTTITSDIDGNPGTEEFALSVSTDGDATIATTYQKSGNNWGFEEDTSAVIATESSPTSTETISAYYLANISQLTNAGEYASTITFITTPNF